MQRLALAVSFLGALACASTTACYAKTAIDAPTASLKVARLQSVEVSSENVPLEIARWLASGASDLPSALLPYGIVPTGTPLPHYDERSQRFDAFHVNEVRTPDEALTREFLQWAKSAGGGVQHADCMYPEFGLDVWHGSERASLLISLSCGKIQVIAHQTRHDEYLTMAQVRAFVSLVKRVFREDKNHAYEGDATEVTRELVGASDGGAP